MLKTINIFLTSLSLGLFCIGVNLYIDLHLGYEFLSIVIALELASVLISIAVSKNITNINIDVLSLVALVVLMASAYLLFAINFDSAYRHFLALLCLIVPVILLSVILINGKREESIGSILIRNMMLGASAGFFASMIFAHFVFHQEGIWGVFMLSSAALTIAIVLQASISNVTKVSALCLFAGVVLYGSNNISMQLTSWSLFDKPVSKHSLNLLKDSETHGWLVEKVVLNDGNRVDIVTTRGSRNEGSFWTIHDANILVPYAHKASSSLTWWKKNYPLMMFPFELKKPSKVLTIATVRGSDASISQQFYGAETTSIYNDCLSLKGDIPCNSSALNKKLIAALNTEKHYDLVSFSNYNEIITPFVGASAQHEAIHTIEVFQNLYDRLNNGGLLAINARNQTALRKSLSYVWRVLSNNNEDRVITFGNKIRVLTLDKYNLQNDAYNYLVLVSKDGFTSTELQKINSFVRTRPVSKIMYDTVANDIPDRLTVTSAILSLTKLSSQEFEELINLEPSSIVKPDYYYLSKTLHPFFSVLSAIFLSLGLYGLIFAHGAMRNLDTAIHQRAPGLAKLLFQVLLCAVSFVLVLYTLMQFTSAALGYSSQYISLLIISTLIAFAIPHVWKNAGSGTLKGLSGLWFHPVNLLLCAFILIAMHQDIMTLLGVVAQVALFVLAVLFAFCSGLLHRQAAMFIEQLYPDVHFWLWCMTSVGVVLGVILAKYILINYDLEIVVQTAMTLFVFVAFIAWWSLTALQDKSGHKSPVLEVPG